MPVDKTSYVNEKELRVVLIEISKITVGKRQRKTVDRAKLLELCDSIRTDGLLQPPGVHRNADGTFRLIWGGRRIAAIQEIQSTDPSLRLRHGSLSFPAGHIPVTLCEGKVLADLLQMELHENIIRDDLPWADKCLALEEIVQARREENPAFTQQTLAQEIVAAATPSSPGPKTLGSAKHSVSKALTVAAALATRPDLARVSSQDEAYNILLREQSNKFEAELSRRKLATIRPAERLWDLRLGDCKDVLPTIPDATVDLVLTDPPYGIAMETKVWSESTRHRYDDSPAAALDLCVFILQESWRLTRPQANLFMFCSIEHFLTLRTAAAQYGWSVLPQPIVWPKGTHGHSPWGRRGFMHLYEILLFATKGQRGVDGPLPDILPTFQKVGGLAKTHGAEKPLELLEYLIEKSTQPSDVVLDPCAGSGSTLHAAVRRRRRAIGVERDQTYYESAAARLNRHDTGATAPAEPPDPVLPSIPGVTS